MLTRWILGPTLPLLAIAWLVGGCAGPIRFNPEATPPGSVWRTAAGRNLVDKWSGIIQVPQKHVVVVNNLGDRPLWVVNHEEGEHYIEPGKRFRAVFRLYGDSSYYEVTVKMRDPCWRWVTETRTYQAGSYNFRDVDVWEVSYLPRSAGCHK